MTFTCAVCYVGKDTFIQIEGCVCKEKMCSGCVKSCVEAKQALVCPTCRVVATKYKAVSLGVRVKSCKVSALIPAGAAAAEGAEAEYVVDYIAGIKSTTDGEVFYKVVWKMDPKKAGVPEDTWEPRSQFNDATNIKQFHDRFCIPLVSDDRFTYPCLMEHGVPFKVIGEDGVVSYNCQDCSLKKGEPKKVVVAHIRKVHMKGVVFKCLKCKTTYASKAARRKHVRVTHCRRDGPVPVVAVALANPGEELPLKVAKRVDMSLAEWREQQKVLEVMEDDAERALDVVESRVPQVVEQLL